MHWDPETILRLNYGRVLARLSDQVARCTRLPLSLADRIAVVKMVILPKLVYLFVNIPITLNKLMFQAMQSCLLGLVWAIKKQKCSWDTLAQPFKRCGFEAPDLRLYYLCAQVQFAHYWYFSQRYLPHLAVEADYAHPIPLTAIVLHNKTQGNRVEINTVTCTIRAWKALAARTGRERLYAPAMPIVAHLDISMAQEARARSVLSTAGITKLGDMYLNGKFLSLGDFSIMQCRGLSTPGCACLLGH